jgi:hypothetical protein
MKDSLGVDSAKEKMIKMLDEDQDYRWQSTTRSMVELVVDPNAYRLRDNTSAHDCSPREIREAIESVKDEREGKMFEDLYKYVYP